MRYMLLMVVLVAVTAYACSESPKSKVIENESFRVTLIDDIDSMQSFEELTKYLETKNRHWEIAKGYSGKEQSFYVEVKGYSHLGVDGKLDIHFVKDKLYEVGFWPKSMISYMEIFQNRNKTVDINYKLVDKQGYDTALIPPYTEVAVFSNHVEWRDTRLQKFAPD